MGTQKFTSVDMKGYSPAVDPTQSDAIYALSGMNFVFDTKGPMSSFGNRCLLPQPRNLPARAQGIRVHLASGDRTFHFFGDGIWEWDETVGGYLSVYLTADTTIEPARWSWAYLAGYIYFCHPLVGLLAFDPVANLCLPHQAIGIATPTNPIGIAVNNGILCVMDPLYFSWSNPGDGTDFTPALGGGGFQLISERVSGTPIAISSYTGGCLTWTTSGVLRSEFTGDAAVFRHRALDTEYRPVDSFCVARVNDDSVIIMDERGLFITNADALTPYSPLFNEFLISFIRENRLKLNNNIRIEWDELQRFLYVSTSFNLSGDSYDTCFVYYQPLDKWGQFNEGHYGILPIQIDDSTRQGTYYGFVDLFANVKYWIDNNSREVTRGITTHDGSNLWYPNIEKAVEFNYVNSSRKVGATGKLRGFVATTLPGNLASYYAQDSQFPQPPPTGPLDSLLQFGLFRPTGPSASDEMSEVVNVLIRSGLSGAGVVTEDWELISGDEDYETSAGPDEDWGPLFIATSHSLRVIGTLDGITPFTQAVPMEIEAPPGAQYYACSVVGVWHIIEISAKLVGESFHVQTGEITATSAGRLL